MDTAYQVAITIGESKGSQAFMASSSEPTETASNQNMNMSLCFKLSGKDMFTTWMFAMPTLLSAYGLADYIDKSKAESPRILSRRPKLCWLSRAMWI